MTTTEHPLPDLAAPDEAEIARLDAWWRATMYLTVGQIYLSGNALLREPLRPEHIKPRLLGHWAPAPAWPSSTPTSHG